MIVTGFRWTVPALSAQEARHEAISGPGPALVSFLALNGPVWGVWRSNWVDASAFG
jgi:hypothetical protein